MPIRTRDGSRKDIDDHINSLKEDLAHFKQDVVGLLQSMVEAGKNTGTEVAHQAQREAAHRVQELRKGLERTRDRGKEALESTQHTIEHHPLAAVLTAIGAGFLFGRFFRS